MTNICPQHILPITKGWATFCPVCRWFVNCEWGRGLPIMGEEYEGAGYSQENKNRDIE